MEVHVFPIDKVVLWLDPAFIPKVKFTFHRMEDMLQPSFCPSPKNDKEKEWHYLDIKRTLSFYLDRTKQFCKTDSMFVSFRKSFMGQRVSLPILSWWVRRCISVVYWATGLDLPIP